MNINTLIRKIYLPLPLPTETDSRSDCRRILDTLAEQGFDSVQIPLAVRQQLYPLLPQSGYRVTASLCFDGTFWQLTGLEAGDTTSALYGLATDLGSTSVAMELVDLSSGQVLASASSYQKQIAHGEDILNRIFYAKDQPEHLQELQQEAVDTLEELMDQLTAASGIDVRNCACMTLAGNTTMTHFLLGLDAFCVFSSPYAVHVDTPGFFFAKEIGLTLHGLLFCFPSRANYLGGDIISGMIATELYKKESISAFFDIGTNGELVIGNRDFLICGAGAAGPALEGGSVTTGMRASDGAIDSIRLSGDDFSYTTIGEKPPIGICGSGITDLMAELFLHGIVDIRGQFVENSSPHLIYKEKAAGSANKVPEGITYAPGLVFYQKDIHEFLRTKAAAYTMMAVLMEQTGITAEDISDYYLAGAFGAHINKHSAVSIGMYPDVTYDRIHTVGNTSLKGARMLLLDRALLDDLHTILEKMEYVQLGSVGNFLEIMEAASYLPHIDIERFPSVKKEILGT